MALSILASFMRPITGKVAREISHLNIMRAFAYSHSMVDGGLLVMS